jgi:hypothetical protein
MQRRVEAFFFCIFLLVMLRDMPGITSADGGRPALTKKDIVELFSKGDLGIEKIFLSQVSDIQQIESTGVVIQTIEPNYVVILGDRHRLEEVRRLGFAMVDAIETDHKLRLFRVLIHNIDDFLRLRAIAADVWPDHLPVDSKFPLCVRGRAYDSEFKWAKEAGLNMELCHTNNCE